MKIEVGMSGKIDLWPVWEEAKQRFADAVRRETLDAAREAVRQLDESTISAGRTDRKAEMARNGYRLCKEEAIAAIRALGVTTRKGEP
jgi:hypothetical protein